MCIVELHRVARSQEWAGTAHDLLLILLLCPCILRATLSGWLLEFGRWVPITPAEAGQRVSDHRGDRYSEARGAEDFA